MIFSFSPTTCDRLKRMTITTQLWLSVTLALVLGLALTTFAFNADQRGFTEQQLNTLGRIITHQTAASSAPLLLAGDQLSLTINLQQLTDLPQIEGAEILSTDGKTLVQVGQPSELAQQQPIMSEATALGSLRIYLNPLTTEYRLLQSLPYSLAASILTLLLIVAAIRQFNRRLNRSLLATSQQPEPNPSDQAREVDTYTHTQTQTQQTLVDPLAGPADNEHPDPPTQPVAAYDSTQISQDPVDEPSLVTTDNNTDTNTYNNTDNNADEMPDHPALAEDLTAPAPLPEASLPDSPDTTPATPVSASSQQDYLLYANHHVGGSDTLTSTERQQLLVRYRKSLEQVARLYKGELREDPLGNWCVRFSPRSNDHSHGINALCAAQLFNALYRGINTQAIRSFSPALNIKLVLLCGAPGSFDTLAEDALLLSDRVQANDLITHQMLYQTQALQDRLLGNAQYRKHDDDTYLISALNSDYQTLIDRQAEHFLKQSC